MQRKLIVVLGALVIALAAVLLGVLLRGQPGLEPISIKAAGENEANPYQAELECIDRVIERNDMDANDVQPAMDSCRASSEPGNRSSGR